MFCVDLVHKTLYCSGGVLKKSTELHQPASYYLPAAKGMNISICNTLLSFLLESKYKFDANETQKWTTKTPGIN